MFINLPKHKLKRDVGLFMLCVIGIGGTIGGGIFVLLSHGAGLAGNYLPLSFMAGGMLAFLGGLMYAELGTTIPRSGSDISLVFSTTRHKYYPFVFSWLILLGDVSYLVINSFGLAFYANFFISVNPILIALGALAVSVLINLRGAGSTGKSEAFTVVALLGLLSLYIVLIFINPQFQFAPGEFITQLPLNILPIIAGTSLVFTTYIGYEYITSIAEEVEDPARNIPKALMVTIAAATIVFTVVSFATVNIIPSSELAEADAPFLLVAEQLGGIGWWVVLPAAIMATAGSLLVATLVASRRLYALSEQGYFGSVFSTLNTKDVPYKAIFGVVIIAVFLLMTNSIAFIAYIGNAVYLAGLIVIAIALMKLRKQRPFLARPFRVPFFPWSAFVMIALTAAVLLFIGTTALAAIALWALLGYFVYLASRVTVNQLYWIMWGAMLFLLVFGVIGVKFLL